MQTLLRSVPMKKTTRRQFINTALIGGAGISALPLLSFHSSGKNASAEDEKVRERFEKIDQAFKQPVLKKAFFPSPVIIESLELLEYNGNYLCRVRSKDGAEGISVAHANMGRFRQIFLQDMRPFFIGQDARELDLLLEKVFIYKLNFRLNGLAVGSPLAAIEFAILDMLGNRIGKSAAELIGEVRNPEVKLYVATEFRELPLEEHFERIKRETAKYDSKALKIKLGFMWDGAKDIHYNGIPGKSEKLIGMVREHYGDDWALYADANGYYDYENAVRIGRILEEYKYGYFEEPVMFYHFEEIKKVAQTLTIPIANGEQEQNFYNYRWLLANEGLAIVEPDTYYFGGFIRSMRAARMADSVGKTCLTHMSGGGLGYVYNALFVSALPNPVEYHEFKGFSTHVPFECPTSPLTLVNSKMKAPSGPGMGVIIDPDFIAKHKVV